MQACKSFKHKYLYVHVYYPLIGTCICIYKDHIYNHCACDSHPRYWYRCCLFRQWSWHFPCCGYFPLRSWWSDGCQVPPLLPAADTTASPLCSQPLQKWHVGHDMCTHYHTRVLKTQKNVACDIFESKVWLPLKCDYQTDTLKHMMGT